MNKNLKTAITTVLFLGLGIYLFYLSVGDDLSRIMEDIKSADYRFILLSVICGILSHLARAMRWNLLLKPLGLKASIAGSFHSVIIGYFINTFLPRVGEVARPAALSRMENLPFNKLVGTILTERIVDLVITLLLAVSIFFLQFDLIKDFAIEMAGKMNMGNPWLYGVIALVSVVALIILYRKRFWFYELPLLKKLKGFIEGMIEGAKSILALKQRWLFIAYSLFIWLMYFMMPFTILYALDGTSHLGVSAGLTVLLFGTAAMIVPIPGGIGTFEVFVPAALALYGIAEGLGGTYAFLTHAIQIIVIFVTGIFSIIYFGVKIQKNNKNELAKENSE